MHTKCLYVNTKHCLYRNTIIEINPHDVSSTIKEQNININCTTLPLCMHSSGVYLTNFHLPGSVNASQLCDNADIVAYELLSIMPSISKKYIFFKFPCTRDRNEWQILAQTKKKQQTIGSTWNEFTQLYKHTNTNRDAILDFLMVCKSGGEFRCVCVCVYVETDGCTMGLHLSSCHWCKSSRWN